MFFRNMFNELIDITLISSTKTTLKSMQLKKNETKSNHYFCFTFEKCSTSYLDLIKVHHSIKERVYSIDQHDYDVNDARIFN